MNFEFEILYFIGPTVKSRHFAGNRNTQYFDLFKSIPNSWNSGASKISYFFKKGKVFRLYQHILIIITFLVQYFKRWDMKIVEFVKQKLRKCLKIVGHLNFSSKSSLTSWPSGLRRQTVFRSFGKNLRWVRGQHFFFYFFKISFDVKFGFYAIFQAICIFPIEIWGHFP